MENPYQSPQEPLESLDASSSAGPFYPREPGFVRHVRVVAILMLVQGVAELLAGIGLGAFAVAMPQIILQTQKDMPQPPDMPQQMFWILTLTYGGMAAAGIVAAVLHLAAGLRNYQFRGRTFGIVALAGGMVSAFTCYCLPTAIGFGIYGLIVYLNSSATEAFRMGDSGRSATEILAAFRQ